MFVKYFLALASLALLFLSTTCEMVDASPNRASPAELIRWVPSDVETLIVCSGPFRIAGIPAADSETWVANADLKDFSDLPLEIGNDGLRHALKGRRVLSYIEGSKNFKPPQGNSGALYDGVHLFCFQQSVRESVGEFLASANATRTVMNGLTVGVLSQEWGSSDRDCFFAVPIPNILVVTTDRTVMSVVLERILSPKLDCVVQKFPGMNVPHKPKFFAIRHYSSENLNPDSDQSDPVICQIDNKAVGFAISSETYTPGRVELSYFSNDLLGAKRLCDETSVRWPDLKARVTFTSAAQSKISLETKSAKQ